MQLWIGPCVAAAMLAFPFTVMAEEDVDGSGDHPMIERVAGSYISTFERTDFDRVTIPTGPHDSGEGEYVSVETREGEHLQFTYRFRDPDTSTLRIKRSYRRALEEAGFTILYADSDAALGIRDGRGFISSSPLFSRPGRRCCTPLTRGDTGIHYIAAESADGSVLVSVATFVASLGIGPVALVDVVTIEDMDYDMAHVPLTVDDMEEGLIEDGRVAIQDILFAFDSAEILPESAAALATIAELMEAQPNLELLVVGHTDGVGDFDYNLRLSLDRAVAVVEYLRDRHAIPGDRLQAAGAGMMAPITSNRSEEGRALNRRVELVELSG
jgi:OmpA-OmpF porin, OOP family